MENSYHCPYCFTTIGAAEGTTPAPEDLLVCSRCGHVLMFRWRPSSEGLRLERVSWGEFQGLPEGVKGTLARAGMEAARSALSWEAPRWN